MIEVRSQPVIEPDPRGGWQLTFWMGDPFERKTPFRTALKDMADALSHENRCSIELPEHDTDEDFVEGTLQLGDKVLLVYFECSLGYLSLSNSSREFLGGVSSLLQATVKVV